MERRDGLRDDPDVVDNNMDNAPDSVTNEEYNNTTDDSFPYPDDTTNDTPVSHSVYDTEENLSEDYGHVFSNDGEKDEDNYYTEALHNKQLYKLEREKYVEALEIIKDLSKKLLEFL